MRRSPRTLLTLLLAVPLLWTCSDQVEPPEAAELLTFKSDDGKVVITGQRGAVPAGGITVKKLDPSKVSAALKQLTNHTVFDRVQYAVELGPSGATFNPPLTLTVTLDDPKLNAGSDWLGYGIFTEQNGVPESLEQATVKKLDDGRYQVQVAISHFSQVVWLPGRVKVGFYLDRPRKGQVFQVGIPWTAEWSMTVRDPAVKLVKVFASPMGYSVSGYLMDTVGPSAIPHTFQNVCKCSMDEPGGHFYSSGTVWLYKGAVL